MTGLQGGMSLAVSHALRERGWTQAELADRCGFSQKHISQILTGKAEGSFETWQTIARRLRMTWKVKLS